MPILDSSLRRRLAARLTLSSALAAIVTGAALLAACTKAGDSKEPPHEATGSASGASANAANASTGSAAQVTPGGAIDSALIRRADIGRIAGDSSASVWVIEVSDFECPYCKMWHDSTYAALRKEFVDNGKVRLAYINFPLSQHPHALPAAEAAMCASEQGKFWPMHDRLFESQDSWKGLPDAHAYFDSLAIKVVGVEPQEYRRCTTTHQTQKLIQADYERAVAAHVNSTPTFIVGKEMLSGAHPIDDLRRAIAAAQAQGATKH